MPIPKGYELTQAGQTADFYEQNYQPPSREDIELDKQVYQQQEQAFSDWDWQGDLGPQGEALPERAIGWKPDGTADFGTGFKGWWNKAYSNVRSAWKTGYEEGLRFDYQKYSEETGEYEDKTTEVKAKDQNQAYWLASMNATKEMFNQALWGVLDGLGSVAQGAEVAIGTAGYTLADAIDPNRDINAETFRQNVNASHMAYSGIFDASIYEEMNRRIESGTRSDLAKQDVMVQKQWTMWPELIGQMVYDPLNLVSAVGKGAQQIRYIKRAQKLFHEVRNPAILKLLEDVENLDDATAFGKIDEFVKTQQGLIAAAEHAEDIATAGKDLDSLSTSYKMASMTRDGKIAHTANMSGEILMHVVNNAGPDEALEILRGMVKSTSKIPEEAAEGVAAMLHFGDPAALFSEAGNKTTVMLSRMMEKYGDNWLKNIEALKGDKSALTKDLLSKLDEVGEEMFPSVSSMLEAEKAVKAGAFTSEAAKTKALALAERAKQLPKYVRDTTRFHDAAQKVVGPINKVFIGAYMGWSPGYAFRNFSNNSLQMLIDYGPGVLLGRADDMFARAERLHGGVLQGAFSEGGQAASLFPGKVGAKDTSAKAILGAVKDKGLQGPVLGMSQKLEVNAAKRIIAKTYTQTFDKGTKAMVRAMTPDLKAAGFSDDIIKKLPTYIVQNDGDATKIINALRADVDSGVIDMFNDVSRIDPKYKSFLSDAGKWDEYSENVLKASTREEATAAAQKIFDDLAQTADFAYRDARPAVGIDDQFLKMAEEKHGVSPVANELFSIRRDLNSKSARVAQDILNEADDLANKFSAQTGVAIPTGQLKKAHGINEVTGWGEEAHKEATRLSSLINDGLMPELRKPHANLTELARKYPEFFEGDIPIDYQAFRDKAWNSYRSKAHGYYVSARDKASEASLGYLDDLKQAGVPVKDEWRDIIKQARDGAAEWDNAVIGAHGEKTTEAVRVPNRFEKIMEIARKNGIETATEAGTPLDKKILNIINKYGDTNFKSLYDPIDINLAERALTKKEKLVIKLDEADRGDVVSYFEETGVMKSVKEKAAKLRAQREAEEAGTGVAEAVTEPRKRLLPPTVEGEAPTISRAIYEQMDEVKKMRSWMMDDITQNFGKKQMVDKVAESAMKKAEKELTQKLAENRLISSRVAQANRDFTLLNYGEKSYWDVALAYLYPFHYWYKGTYKNWLTRVAANPAILAHYSKYKEVLGTVHADMPEWYKYNINTNDLPGVDVENPLFFNLEATLWPLNGLTNVDFEDKDKRVNFWTSTLDFANKFGPSTWTPINMVTGLALYQQGEKEAGERWMGRALPQSATIKAGASLLGITNLETDPFVGFLQGGLDPYERRRVGRALAAMAQEGAYTDEQIQDAAYSQEGPIWEEAIKRSTRGRAPSQISSFLFGVGFKGRTKEDVQIDKFYSDYNKLWTMRPNVTPEEFREGMDSLKKRYPFMDAVLLSRRSGVERDAGLAYNVLTRIPPGKTNEIAEAVGIEPELLDKFFADKGQIEKWSKADYQRLMSGVLNMAAVLEIPSDMTRSEWTKAKNAYSGLSTEAKDKFGEDILDLADGYYQAKTKGTTAANAYLDKHPELSEYMDWKAQRIMESPLLSAYYGGASQIEGYYRSQMYADIEKQLGTDIFDVLDEYNNLKTFGEGNEAKIFYNQHRAEIKKYYALKDQWQITIDQKTAELSAKLPEGQGAGIREDYDSTSVTAQNLVNSLQPEEQMTYQDFQEVIPDRLMNLVNDYIYQGERLPESAEKQLGRLAQEMGYPDAESLIQAIGTSMYQQ